ncbi:MAG: energy transducer TonB [Gemmatimonadota bacterium]|nr:energy transducer TonB [Gemmatimonadota bacterium]
MTVNRGWRRLRATGLHGVVVPLIAFGCGGDGVIEQPTPMFGEAPVAYPLELWDRNVEGETLLRVRVTNVGEVDSVEVAESSGHPAFDSAAVAGARELKFRPARRDGKRIRVWAEVPIRFSRRPQADTVGIR